MSDDGDTVREALRVPPEGHHRRCNTWDDAECDCYMCDYDPALAAIARLEAAEAERRRLREALDWIEAEPEDPLKVQLWARAALAGSE